MVSDFSSKTWFYRKLGSRIIEPRRERGYCALISALNRIHISEKVVSEPVKLTVAVWGGWRCAEIITGLEVSYKWLPFFIEKVFLRSLEFDPYIRSKIPVLHSVHIEMHVSAMLFWPVYAWVVCLGIASGRTTTSIAHEKASWDVRTASWIEIELFQYLVPHPCSRLPKLVPSSRSQKRDRKFELTEYSANLRFEIG